MQNQCSKLLTATETADFLSIKLSKLRSMVFRKEIPYLKINRLLRFDKRELLQWLDSKRVRAGP